MSYNFNLLAFSVALNHIHDRLPLNIIGGLRLFLVKYKKALIIMSDSNDFLAGLKRYGLFLLQFTSDKANNSHSFSNFLAAIFKKLKKHNQLPVF